MIGDSDVEINFVAVVGMKSDLAGAVAIRLRQTFAPLLSLRLRNEIETILSKYRNWIDAKNTFHGRRSIPDIVLLIGNENNIPGILKQPFQQILCPYHFHISIFTSLLQT